MRNKLIGGFIVVFAIVGISAANHKPTPTTQINSSPTSSQSTLPISSDTSPASTVSIPPTTPSQTVTIPAPAPETTTQATNTGVSDTNLSNNNTYTNVDGNTVHSPAASTNGAIPAGATAQCVDGTYSFSQHHSGTCSHHGGVSTWL